MFNLAIDSKLRGCDVVAIKVEDVPSNGYTVERPAVRQRKTCRPVKFELTEQTRQSDRRLSAGVGKEARRIPISRAAVNVPERILAVGERHFAKSMKALAV